MTADITPGGGRPADIPASALAAPGVPGGTTGNERCARAKTTGAGLAPVTVHVKFKWPFERRATEAALTIATLTFLVVSVTSGQSDLPSWLHRSFDVASYVTGGWFALAAAVPKLARGTLDVDFLMLFAACGAASTGHWHEGSVLLFLFSLSNTLQSYAMDRSRRAIGTLLKRRPRTAVVLRDTGEETVPIDALRIRDIMLLRPGEMVSTDGVVRRGQTEMDESSITGEAKAIDKGPGDLAYAGAINGTGAVEIEVTRAAEDSTLARIVKMVESAEKHKARSQRFLERLEGAYAWAIVALVGVLIVVPWWLDGADLRQSFYRAMVVLVVASPCALVISTPAAILSAVAHGARQGMLFKGGAYLENMAEVKVVVFDKTGTLTTGKPGVTDLVLSASVPRGFTERDLLATAAALESRSEHPLAREIVVAAVARGAAPPGMEDFVALPGRGVHAHIAGYLVWIGSDRLYREHGETIPPDLADAKARLEAEGKSVLILHREIDRRDGVGVHETSGGWLGLIGMADTVRPQAAATVAALHELGIERTVMLTGDNPHVARAVAAGAGIDEVHANLLPEDKVRVIAELKARYGPVMMIGDGVNDAPALANASVGVAMGTAGVDLALETAHCVLLSDDLSKVPAALSLSRRTRRTIVVNLSFSAAVIVALIAATFVAGIALPVGVLGHEGSTVIVCLNGLRLLAAPRTGMRRGRRFDR